MRDLAAQLAVSPSTVSRAFGELRRRGLVSTRDRGGSRVGERPPIGGIPAPAAVPPGVVDLATGNPDPRLLPALSSASAAQRPDWTQRLYGEPSSMAELVEPVVEHVLRARASPPVAAAPARGLVVSGAMDGIERALTAALSGPSLVALEDPGYDSLIALVRALGHEPVPMPLDARGPTPDGVVRALDAGVRAMIVTNRAQNPTGAALDGDRARALTSVLAGHDDVFLVEDDHLGDVSGADLHSLAGATEHWMHVHSFAKSLGPDLRVAVAVGDPRTVGRMEGRQSLGPGWVSGILQGTVVAMLRDPDTARALDGARVAYTGRREALTRALSDAGFPVQARSGFNVCVPVPDEAAAVAGLLTRGWAVASGVRYRLSSAPAIRVTVSALHAGRAEEFVADLAEAVHRPPRRSG